MSRSFLSRSRRSVTRLISASRSGIEVFATGGIGGVHRGASETFDESADLSTLAVTPITVVSAGVKSVLDIAATLERLETYSVPVIGLGTTVFPSFWLRESAFTLDWSVDSPADVAAVMVAHDALGHRQGIVVANPVPADQAWEREEHDRVLAEAFAAAERAGVTGKAVTPFLLGTIVELSEGRSLEVNLDLARNNVRVAGEIARAWAARAAKMPLMMLASAARKPPPKPREELPSKVCTDMIIVLIHLVDSGGNTLAPSSK